MVTVRITRAYRVDCQAIIDLPFPVPVVWKRLMPWSISATWDPFHRRIVQLEGADKVGGRIIIDHRFGPICIARAGRLLRLNPERGFAFSDLSLREQRGFPHSYSYDLKPGPDKQTRLTIRVRGRWTLRIGRLLVWLWLGWVMLQLQQKTKAHLTLSFGSPKGSI